MTLLTPALFGIGTGLPLIVGAVVGVIWRPPEAVVGSLLAFASGSLITGLAFELFEPAYQSEGPVLTTVCFLTGTGLYIGAKSIVDGREGTSGGPLLVAVIFDGLAENVTLGVILAGTATSAPLAILIGIAANNFPEAIGGAASMTGQGKPTGWTLALWTATATGLTLAVIAGYVVFAGASNTVLAIVQATGGGAVLASLAIEIMPDAYNGGGSGVAFATAVGFVVTFLIA